MRKRWINVRGYNRRNGISVRKHRRRVPRKIPNRIVKTFKILSNDPNREYGIALDYELGMPELESIHIMPGKRYNSTQVGKAIIKIATDPEQRNITRDYEILIHTHPNINNALLDYPSPDDIATFIVDSDNGHREYDIMIYRNNAYIMSLPQKTRQKLQKKYFLRDKNGIENTKHYDKFLQQLKCEFDNEKKFPTTKHLTDHIKKKYGIKIQKVNLKQLDKYNFKIIPQENDKYE